MRTTLVLDDAVFEKAKRYAFEKGTTLSELTSLALKILLMREASQPQKKKKKITISTYGEPGVKRDFSSEMLASIRDERR